MHKFRRRTPPESRVFALMPERCCCATKRLVAWAERAKGQNPGKKGWRGVIIVVPALERRKLIHIVRFEERASRMIERESPSKQFRRIFHEVCRMDKSTERVEDVISRYIAENILFSKKGYPYSLDASFLENGIVDSVNVLELVMFIEGTFKVKVDDSDITPDNFDSVSKLAGYVRARNGAA